MKFLFNKKITLSLLIIISIIIFLFSSQNGTESGKISSSFIIRKIGHFSEYALLGAITLLFIKNYLRKKNNSFSNFTIIIISWCYPILFAISDEFHQTFIPGRVGSYKDVIIDSCGSLIGILIVNYIFYKKYKINKQNNY